MPRAIARVLLIVVVGCGTTETPGDGGVEPHAGEKDGGSGDDAGASCDPTPERCDGLGDERPPRFSEHSAVYDQGRREMIVFGGTSTVPEACNFPSAEFSGETWIYDDVCNGWTQVEGEGPSPTGRHMASVGDDQVWLFGGRFRPAGQTGPYALYDDLFRFDLDTRTWSVVDVSGERPGPRVNGGLAWDSKRERLWLFGGNTSPDGAFYAPQADLWSFDPEDGQWQSHGSDGAPAPRLFHSVFYDAARDRLVVHGGADESAFSNEALYRRDLWALSLDDMRWSLLDAGDSGPDGRFWGALVHDTGDDDYVLFGGHDDTALGNRNDTWRFDVEDGQWTRVAAGDTFNAPARGFCDFPPDFTEVDEEQPERRNAHGFVWSETCGHGLIFGGKTDCGAIDDVWMLQGDRWSERLEATEGEVCLRWRDDPETCSDMCF